MDLFEARRQSHEMRSKIGTDFLGRFYGEAYQLKTFVTRMGTHTGARRSDVFFESTVAKQIALIESKLQEPVIIDVIYE